MGGCACVRAFAYACIAASKVVLSCCNCNKRRCKQQGIAVYTVCYLGAAVAADRVAPQRDPAGWVVGILAGVWRLCWIRMQGP